MTWVSIKLHFIYRNTCNLVVLHVFRSTNAVSAVKLYSKPWADDRFELTVAFQSFTFFFFFVIFIIFNQFAEQHCSFKTIFLSVFKAFQSTLSSFYKKKVINPQDEVFCFSFCPICYLYALPILNCWLKLWSLQHKFVLFLVRIQHTTIFK